MENKGLEQRVTALEKEIESLKKHILNIDRIDCGYYDVENNA